VIDVRLSRSPEDDVRSLAIHNVVFPHWAFAPEDARAFKDSLVAADDYVASFDGTDVGSLFIGIHPSRPDVVFAEITVLGEHRRRGVGRALFAAVSEWTVEHGLTDAEGFVDEDDASALAWVERRGLREVGRNTRAVLDLTKANPIAVDPPAGIEISTWAERPDAIRGMYEVAAEALPDIPGDEDALVEPFEDWLEHEMRGPGDRPEATFVAFAGDEVVGYAKFSLTRARPKTASHDITGVKRAWRGRGIAGALKRAQIAWAKQAGYEELVTGNEVRNLPIRRLNERLGYRVAPGRILVRGPVSGGA
jgi:mycothiol synthase